MLKKLIGLAKPYWGHHGESVVGYRRNCQIYAGLFQRLPVCADYRHCIRVVSADDEPRSCGCLSRAAGHYGPSGRR